MKKFIVNVVLFGLLLLLINVVFYLVAYNRYYKDYEQYDLNYDSYLFADSHGTPIGNQLEKYGIYNFSAASDSYFDMLIKIKYLIKHTNIERIFITVDDHTLSPYRENANNLERSSYFIISEDYSNVLKGIGIKLDKFLVLLNPGIRGIVRSYFQSMVLTTKVSKNWNLLTPEEQNISAQSRFIEQFNYENKSEQLTETLIRIIELCKENNIEIIGIQFPLSEVYFAKIGDKSFGANAIFMKNQLKVYDYRELFFKHDDFFMNQDHLNEIGSKEFVKSYLTELITIK
jgi:hypothetical protein